MTNPLRLGDLLLARQLITEDDLDVALEEQKNTGTKLGKLLIQMQLVEETALCTLLSEQLGIPFVELRDLSLEREALEAVPEALCKKFQVCGLYFDDSELVVGTPDPGDIIGLDEVMRVTGLPVKPVILVHQQWQSVIAIAFDSDEEIKQLANAIAANTDAAPVVALAQFEGGEDAQERPVGRFMQKVFDEAIQSGASDIHIEPDKDVLRIRQRIDGQLTEQVMKTTEIMTALVVRLKLMANLDIAEKRRPQDGRFEVAVGQASVDVRMSTMPVQHGESVVLRLLDARQGLLPLTSLGMSDADLVVLKRQLKMPHGLLLVTGPTGSGKTTTLYSALNEMNTPRNKIITVEDPVEFSLPRINQVQVADRIGLDFPTVLRAALRQDPDMLLIGEIRDSVSADIALRASLTGHLVLSTLHTNDAPAAPVRLIDMGIESYLVASSLSAVIAQRLIRQVCKRCAVSYTPSALECNVLERAGFRQGETPSDFRIGTGCVQCFDSGYRGRIGVFEILEIDHRVAGALRANDIGAFHQAVNEQPGYRPIWKNALQLALSGQTSITEALKYSDMSQFGEPSEAPQSGDLVA
jgi:MSHA biogenesis protein MshE